MIRPGEKLDPALRLVVVRGGATEEVALGDLLRRRTIVSVYMKNNTPGCDRQTATLAEHAPEFAQTGFDLLAVSRDSSRSHIKYAAAKGIPYALVSDPEDAFARATGSLVEKRMYGRSFTGPARAAYVLAADGTVLAVVPKVDTQDHAAQLRAVIARL